MLWWHEWYFNLYDYYGIQQKRHYAYKYDTQCIGLKLYSYHIFYKSTKSTFFGPLSKRFPVKNNDILEIDSCFNI